MHREPLDGRNVGYSIELPPWGESAKASAIWGSSLVVSGKNSGSTSDHNRFVWSLNVSYLKKTNRATALRLKKDGNEINVVVLRYERSLDL